MLVAATLRVTTKMSSDIAKRPLGRKRPLVKNCHSSLLLYHLSLRISLQIFAMRPAGILIVIALNL